MNSYQETIRDILARRGLIGMDPRHVEAYMRLDHSTLDGLSRDEFQSEVVLSAGCVATSGAREAELLAQSMGL